MACRLEHLILGLSPNIESLSKTLERLKVKVIICQYTKRRDDIFPKILILIIAPNDNHIGLEGIDFLTDASEGVEYLSSVRLVGGDAVIISPFQAHGF